MGKFGPAEFVRMTAKEKRDSALRRQEELLEKARLMEERARLKAERLERMKLPSPVLITKKPSEEG